MNVIAWLMFESAYDNVAGPLTSALWRFYPQTDGCRYYIID